MEKECKFKKRRKVREGSGWMECKGSEERGQRQRAGEGRRYMYRLRELYKQTKGHILRIHSIKYLII